MYGTHASTEGNLGHRADCLLEPYIYIYVCACLSSVTNQCTYTVGRKIIHASQLARKFILENLPEYREINFSLSFSLYVIVIGNFSLQREYFIICDTSYHVLFLENFFLFLDDPVR